MYVTHSYLGTTKGRFRCQFFLLLEDYIQAQSQFVRELDLSLERFARNMKDSGVLVRPFAGDIENTKSDVLEKPWSDGERKEICRTPGLLMIDVDFDKFDPRKNCWLHFCFGARMVEGIPATYHFGEALSKLATAVCEANTNVFHAANAIIRDVRFADAAKVFEAKPGIFGFSVDLVKGGEFLENLYRKIVFKRSV
jgi:hypothetical protein